ncbi:MAG: GNAT family N-acetyltransferase [Acidimicrobiia bacterium]|nr:GNAT family N-acetyltransferase [Acidimicrobiia bacterium]
MVEQEWVQELEDTDDNPPEDGMIAVSRDGTPVAIAFVQIPPATDLWRATGWGAVHPDYRGAGIGRAILAWREARATERSLAVRADVPKFLWETLYDRQSGPVLFLTENGYRPVRHWFEMVRDLSLPIDPAPLGSGLELIRYGPELSEAVREANNDAFRDHWGSQPIARERWERHYVGGESFRPDLSAVVVDGAKVVGLLVAGCFPHDFEDKGRTEVWAEIIGTRREYRARGIASALIVEWMRIVVEAGYEYAVLGVDAASETGALGLYERHGFTLDTSSTSYAKPLEGTDWSALDHR